MENAKNQANDNAEQKIHAAANYLLDKVSGNHEQAIKMAESILNKARDAGQFDRAQEMKKVVEMLAGR